MNTRLRKAGVAPRKGARKLRLRICWPHIFPAHDYSIMRKEVCWLLIHRASGIMQISGVQREELCGLVIELMRNSVVLCLCSIRRYVV